MHTFSFLLLCTLQHFLLFCGGGDPFFLSCSACDTCVSLFCIAFSVGSTTTFQLVTFFPFPGHGKLSSLPVSSSSVAAVYAEMDQHCQTEKWYNQHLCSREMDQHCQTEKKYNQHLCSRSLECSYCWLT